TYGYDDLYRLATATGPEGAEGYTYDLLGNRLTSLETEGLWTYNANNELITNEGATYDYDLNGNTITKTTPSGIWSYVYDMENRLVEVKKDGQEAALYGYDPFGRRLWKSVNGIKTYFAYSDEGLVAEYDSTGTIQKSYGYLPGSLWTTNPLYLATDEADGIWRYYWYQNDNLGTPKALTDENGRIVWSASAEAFGETSVDAGSVVVNNLRFPGQYEDAETGLHYNYHRYYDPETGRYVSEDPIYALNLYHYAKGKPIRHYDPDGRLVAQVCGAAAVALTACLMADSISDFFEKANKEMERKEKEYNDNKPPDLKKDHDKIRELAEQGLKTIGDVPGTSGTGPVSFDPIDHISSDIMERLTDV
ncbi:hypothetical protein EPN96_08070, partial [bacterium]